MDEEETETVVESNPLLEAGLPRDRWTGRILAASGFILNVDSLFCRRSS